MPVRVLTKICILSATRTSTVSCLRCLSYVYHIWDCVLPLAVQAGRKDKLQSTVIIVFCHLSYSHYAPATREHRTEKHWPTLSLQPLSVPHHPTQTEPNPVAALQPIPPLILPPLRPQRRDARQCAPECPGASASPAHAPLANSVLLPLSRGSSPAPECCGVDRWQMRFIQPF